MEHGASVELLLALAVIIAAAKAGGYILVRLNQPAVLGELLAGVILGPSVIDMLAGSVFHHPEAVAQTVDHLAELGVLVLMFVAGLEIDLEELLASGRPATLAGIFGVIVPLVGGTAVALAFGREPVSALFIGVILTATSVSISAQTLMELGVLRSVVGLTLLAAAVVDDVLVILILSAFLALAGGGGSASIGGLAIIFVRMVGYLLLAIAVGKKVVVPVVRRVADLGISEGVLVAALVTMLLYAWSAEALGGVAAITGAFLAGLFLASSPVREEIENGTHALAYGFLVPVFFVSVGLNANVRELALHDLPFTGVLIVVAILAKVVGSGVGANLGGLDRRRALQVGLGMISRGEVGLIVAGAGLNVGLISQREFTEVVLMVLVTTLVTPLLLRRAIPATTEDLGGGQTANG